MGRQFLINFLNVDDLNVKMSCVKGEKAFNKVTETLNSAKGKALFHLDVENQLKETEPNEKRQDVEILSFVNRLFWSIYPYSPLSKVNFQGVYPSDSVLRNATIAASSSVVRPKSPSSSVLTCTSTSGSGHASTSLVL